MSTSDISGFIAYPASQKEVGESIRIACADIKRQFPSSRLQSWEANDLAGYCLIDPILEQIRNSKLLIADITQLNFNVAYEIGFAVGLKKRVFLKQGERYTLSESARLLALNHQRYAGEVKAGLHDKGSKKAASKKIRSAATAPQGELIKPPQQELF